MFERPVALVTCRTLPCVLVTQVHRVLEGPARGLEGPPSECLLDGRVTDAALVPDYLALSTHMLAVMTTKAALRVVVPDVVDVGLPVRVHLREEIRLVYLLHFDDGRGDRLTLRRENVGIARPVEVGQSFLDRRERFVCCRVRS